METYMSYTLMINKLKAFVTNNSGFVGSDNNFNNNTNIGKMFWDMNFDLQRQGYTHKRPTLEQLP